MQPALIIGTRGSPLALAQAHWVRAQILAHRPGLDENAIRIDVISTKGDEVLDRALAPIGGKGLFTQEIEQRLADGRVDLGVHSMKDMPTHLPQGLMLGPSPVRADPRDMLISKVGSIAELPKNAKVGTASLRRRAQLLAVRGDLAITLLRGNVQRRMAHIEDGRLDATLLAAAGLERLGLRPDLAHPLEVEDWLPAPGQGILALELREGDDRALEFITPFACPDATRAAQAERAAMAALDGDCRTPIAAHATITGDRIDIAVEILSSDGKTRFRERAQGSADAAAALGRAAGLAVAAAAGPDFIAHMKAER